MSAPHDEPGRDELAARYLDQLPFAPYPVQEEALLTWFTTEQGVLVCAPTGTGKTLIAEAALFEALHSGQQAYYTTPLIALTEQKFREVQEAAVRWGFREEDVGLVTGNRRVNPEARVLVVVAEILLNRLLHTTAFDFSQVASVVMDEFHSFNDPERGIVWELSLALLPKHIRLLLLSATVGNSAEFIVWMYQSHERRLDLVQSTERRVPLTYQWVGDELLTDFIEKMAEGDEATRRTPALVFCFNREECWNVAEQLKGKSLLPADVRKRLMAEVERMEWSQGVGPKLKTLLMRGVGVHHAGLLPKYRRRVEWLFQRKLLSVAVCTETLSAGINLPARSVVVATLLKGPPGKKKLIDPSSAHQMFGRAGRPQFDDRGYVFALAHEDDVKILRWKEKYDQIPEDTKDPGLLKAKKALKKKMPTRRKTEQYWTEEQFEKLKTAPPGKLSSKGQLPWRLLAYLLDISPEVEPLRRVVSKRLMDAKKLQIGQRDLTRMLRTLGAGGYVVLDPPPPPPPQAAAEEAAPAATEAPQKTSATLSILLNEARANLEAVQREKKKAGQGGDARTDDDEFTPDEYRPVTATPTEKLSRLLVFRGVNPLYGAFLVEHLGKADTEERIQAFESVLDMPGSVVRSLRVPRHENLPPGPLARDYLDTELLQRGLATQQELFGSTPEEEENRPWDEERVWVLTLADKLRLLFQSEYPGVGDFRITPVWAVGELLRFEGDFNKLVTSRKLAKQEGILFRHVLRYILLMDEFVQVCPPDMNPDDWQSELKGIAQMLTDACRQVDPESTEHAIEAAHAAADVVEGEAHAVEGAAPSGDVTDADEEFGVFL